MKHIELEETASTNTWLAEHSDSYYIGESTGDHEGTEGAQCGGGYLHGRLPEPVMVRTRCQTAGRGQRGNSWESAPGENLTASILLSPAGVLPREQFAVSEAVALAVCDVVRRLVPEAQVKVKWPNDIYIGDRKVCGILIEHSICGTEIKRTIAGVGLNINQRKFVSDAPNPVSLWQLTGRVESVAEVARLLGERVEARIDAVARPEGRDMMHREFMQNLWRGDGAFWPFIDSRTGIQFDAKIVGVEPEGYLQLLKMTGELRKFAFKEVQFVIKC